MTAPPGEPDALPRSADGYPDRQAIQRAPWALDERSAGDRDHEEPPDPLRTCFQVDRDRVMRCPSFRRLDFKTQVFVPHQQDHFRTRLTHTLEVAHVGRDLARGLGANEDLVEVVALAHDLGHPPFGHEGEALLDQLMAEAGGFEHNRQSLRIVEQLEHPFPQFHGLNLTPAVRRCLGKHTTPGDGHLPLEGQLADLADEIAYTSADIEDALHARWISAGDLSELALWNRAWERAISRCPGAREIHKEIQTCRLLPRMLADDVLLESAGRLSAARPAGPEDVVAASVPLAGLSAEVRGELDEAKRWLHARVYRSAHIQQAEQRSIAMMRELFEAYQSDPDRLPDRYRRRLAEQPARTVICDYIAGMTDRFCREQHARVVG